MHTYTYIIHIHAYTYTYTKYIHTTHTHAKTSLHTEHSITHNKWQKFIPPQGFLLLLYTAVTVIIAICAKLNVPTWSHLYHVLKQFKVNLFISLIQVLSDSKDYQGVPKMVSP
jgi:hypothetical protein